MDDRLVIQTIGRRPQDPPRACELGWNRTHLSGNSIEIYV